MFSCRILLACVLSLSTTALATAAPKLNIVWIVTEDISTNLGCYADPDARTPNLDKFATQGTRYTRFFTHAPVCAPTRSGLITGQYATTLGSHHMRSKLVQTPRLFTQELQAAGYRVFWPGKTDFNFDVKPGWANTTDWTKKPELLRGEQPFFAYINFTSTHESQIRAPKAAHQKVLAKLPPEHRHDPKSVHLPPYFPDTPEVRHDVAQYHDNISGMDQDVGRVLKVLDDEKLSQNTVVVFFGDHGWGMPRGKRTCLDSGLQAPLLVRWPGQLTPGSVDENLVAFIDLAPTVLSIAGVPIPERFQGQVAFGPKAAAPREYVYSARDRMDETFDRVRTVRSKQFRYVKNFHPEIPYAAWLNYADEMPTRQVWRKLAFEGKLNPIQMQFFAKTKPPEELYDCTADPHEVNNLASDPAHAATLKTMRAALDRWIVETKDLGEVPEQELIDRKLVKDLLNNEYANRNTNHPKTSPVP